MKKRQFKFICLLAERTEIRLHPRTWLVSVPIRVVCNSAYSHYSILLQDELDGSFHVIESTWPKVNIKTYQEWYEHADRTVLPQFLDDSIWPFDLPAVLSLEGTSYPVKDIIENLLDIARANIGFGHRWNGQSGKVGRPGVFCTELVATGMRYRYAYRVRPNDFFSPFGIVGITNGEEFRTYKGQEAMLPQFLQYA